MDFIFCTLLAIEAFFSLIREYPARHNAQYMSRYIKVDGARKYEFKARIRGFSAPLLLKTIFFLFQLHGRGWEIEMVNFGYTFLLLSIAYPDRGGRMFCLIMKFIFFSVFLRCLFCIETYPELGPCADE